VVFGELDKLDWFKTEVQSRFEVNFRGMVWPDSGDVHDMRNLNMRVHLG